MMLPSPSSLFFLALIIFSSNSSAFVNRSLLTVSAMSTDSNKNNNPTTMLESKEEKEVLQLPEASNDPSIPSIKLGESIKFEDMGPVIINADGTTRQIANWDKMTQAEQEVAWRRISKRNEERRKILLEQQQLQQQEQMNEEKNE